MHKRYGFTAVELVIAMVVIGILLTIGVIGLRSTQTSARDKERETDVANIKNYLESIYYKEIKNRNGKIVKQAGTYPALPEEVDDTTADLELIFEGLDQESMTPPGVSPRRKTPSIPYGNDYIPSQSTNMCGNYMNCYSRPNNVRGSISQYIYAPGPVSNDLCTSVNANSMPSGSDTSGCRMYQIIYRTETGNRRVVVESKRK